MSVVRNTGTGLNNFTVLPSRVVTYLGNMAILLALKINNGDRLVTMKLLARLHAIVAAHVPTASHAPSMSASGLLVVAAIALPSPVFASAGGHSPSFADLTFYWVNFILYVGLMSFLLRKPIKNAWVARTARIKQTVLDCTDQVESAERELNAIEALTKGLAAEQERVCQEIVEQANLEAQEILKNANQRAARIREQAKEMVKGETRSAQVSFRSTLVARALELARAKFSAGEFASREQAYVGAAVTRAKGLLQ